MKRSQGFSLFEVLVSLLLITGTTLALMQQQWQLSRLLNQLLTSSQELVLSDNQYDRL